MYNHLHNVSYIDGTLAVKVDVDKIYKENNEIGCVDTGQIRKHCITTTYGVVLCLLGRSSNDKMMARLVKAVSTAPSKNAVEYR